MLTLNRRLSDGNTRTPPYRTHFVSTSALSKESYTKGGKKGNGLRVGVGVVRSLKGRSMRGNQTMDFVCRWYMGR